jgi:hypothetical protein
VRGTRCNFKILKLKIEGNFKMEMKGILWRRIKPSEDRDQWWTVGWAFGFHKRQ